MLLNSLSIALCVARQHRFGAGRGYTYRASRSPFHPGYFSVVVYRYGQPVTYL